MGRPRKYPLPLTGERFGRWVVVGAPTQNRHGQTAVWVRCDCGQERILTPSALQKTRSCGCEKDREAKERFWKHGAGLTSLYGRWSAMLARCYNPNTKSYPIYGGRGITVCTAWRSDFIAFRDWATATGYSEDLELDRRDTNGNYEPANCRWITKQANTRNRRSNRIVEAFGERRPLNAWLDDPRCVVGRATLRQRLVELGWDAERALTEPPKKLSRKEV